jgi:hypothetical protein
MLRMILWAFLFYVVFKTMKNLTDALHPSPKSQDVNEKKKKSQTKYRIEKEDVIDAYFEDIDSKTKDKPNQKS